MAGILAFSHAETVEVHAWVTRALEFEGRVTAFRVWVQRGTNEVLGEIVGLPATETGLVAGDRIRATAELEALRELVAGDPVQQARVDELATLLDRRIATEEEARKTFEISGTSGAVAVLEGAGWGEDRRRIHAVTSSLLAKAREDFRVRDAEYVSTMRRARVALLSSLVLMLGTVLYLLRQLGAAQRSREQAVEASALARQRLADLEGVLDTVPAAVLIARDPECREIRGNRFAEALLRAEPGSDGARS
ncbi:MAG: hypothetical protein WCP63_05740, partial [Cyanobium sp. ELA712]